MPPAERLRWTVLAPEIRDALDTLDPAAAVLAEPPAKRNLVRTVVPCTLGPHRAFLKIHRARGPLDALKLALAPKAALEADLAVRLRTRGVPAIEPLAHARDASASYLLTRALPGARPLHDLLPTVDRAERRRLAAMAGAFLADLHRARLWHPDLHTGNLLVSPGPDGAPWLHVADLPAARLVPTVGRPLAVRAMAMLAASMACLTRTDLLRALKAYGGGTLPPGTRRLAADVLAARDRIWATHWRSRTRRCVRTTGAFLRRREGPLTAVVRRDVPEGALGAALAAHDGIQAEGGPRAVKRDRGTRVSRGIPGPDGTALCVKAYLPRGPLDILRRASGLTRARRAWIAANALAERDLPTAKPLAWAEQADGTGYLVTEDLSVRALELDRFLEARWSGLDTGSRRRLVAAAAALFRKLGERGAWPGDAKACNLFVEASPDGAFLLRLVDVDGVSQRRPDSLDLARTLSQLHLSVPRAVGRLARARFLRLLLGRSRHADWGPFARMALRLAAGRPVLYQGRAGDVEEAPP